MSLELAEISERQEGCRAQARVGHLAFGELHLPVMPSWLAPLMLWNKAGSWRVLAQELQVFLLVQPCLLSVMAARTRQDTRPYCVPHPGGGPKSSQDRQGHSSQPEGVALGAERLPQLNVERKILTQMFSFKSDSSLTRFASGTGPQGCSGSAGQQPLYPGHSRQGL